MNPISESARRHKAIKTEWKRRTATGLSGFDAMEQMKVEGFEGLKKPAPAPPAPTGRCRELEKELNRFF